MLIHHLSRGASEHQMASHRLPEHHAQRIEIRTDVYTHSCELLGTGKLWCPDKARGYRNRGLRTWFIDRLCKAEVDDFRGHSGSLLQTHHDVAWFNVPVNELLFVHRCQTGGDLRRNFQRQLYLEPAGAFDEILERSPLYKLHRVKVVLTGSAQVENRGNVWVTNARRRGGFAKKAKPRRFITEISLADDFQC